MKETQDEDQSDFIRDKDLILSFRDKCDISAQINRLLFGDDGERDEAHDMINFYNSVKKIFIKCGGADDLINMKIFAQLIKELRIKLEITKMGHVAERTMTAINFGLDLENENASEEELALMEVKR